MSNGFVKLHRKMTEWGWYSDSNTFRVFMHLLLTAQYKDTEWLGYKIKAGQAIAGRKRLAEELGITEHQVRVALDHLKMTNEVAIKTTNKFSIVTIVNWEKYQINDSDSDQQNGQQNGQQVANKWPTSGHYSRKKESKEYIYNPPIVPPYEDQVHTGKTTSKKFKPPTVEEVKAYCKERGNRVNAETFVDFYESKGWMVGKSKMKSWKASVRTWEKRNDDYTGNTENRRKDKVSGGEEEDFSWLYDR